MARRLKPNIVSLSLVLLCIPCVTPDCSRPPDCGLHCPSGYVGLGGQCLCACRETCQTKLCRTDEMCTEISGAPQCVRKEVIVNPACPRLTNGVCAMGCMQDGDCGGRLICCPNGCGRECVAPMRQIELSVKAVQSLLAPAPPARPTAPAPAPAVPTIPAIVPVRRPNISKTGECPRSTIVDKECGNATNCEKDDDCQGHAKCCSAGCGRVCVAPTRTTDCIHLASAVLRLPEHRLAHDYVPTCTADGAFASIQCDARDCWCVSGLGHEREGTRRERERRDDAMCHVHARRCAADCRVECPHGLRMDREGCPLTTCECRNICEAVRCASNADECQLVEPQCAVPPCLPVPRCLLNPCPRGLPMTLSSGVTALCTHSDQCSPQHWCHQVGYNGLGFCCGRTGSAAETTDDTNACPARQPLPQADECESTCQIDEDCDGAGKCCFDGCGLTCVSFSFRPHPTFKNPPRMLPGDIAKHNKGLISSIVAECPLRLPPSLAPLLVTCKQQCEADSQCEGQRRCCHIGCASVCAFPHVTTACLHDSITAEVYSLRSVRRCDRAGNYEHVQCDDDGCFCVDLNNGEEMAGTRRKTGEVDCQPLPGQCKPLHCKSHCPHGYALTSLGCPTCRCRNPCMGVKCPQGEFCLMTPVACYQPDTCPHQPRCVVNVCPTGEPFISSDGFAESCGGGAQCPPGFYCNEVGLPSGGVCCKVLSAPIRPRVGECPAVAPSLDRVAECSIRCRADSECARGKCCYDGCGTRCTDVPLPPSLTTTPTPPTTTSTTWTPPPTTPSTRVHYVPAPTPIVPDRSLEVIRTAIRPVEKTVEKPVEQNSVLASISSPSFNVSTSTACRQLAHALTLIGHPDPVKCASDGRFAPKQCAADECWCVSEDGEERPGTRRRRGSRLECDDAVVPTITCPPIECGEECAYGKERDARGCETCHCHEPCEGVTCPLDTFCAPHAIDCKKQPCPHVPRCVLNPCPVGVPLLNRSQPIECSERGDCSQGYCRLYRSDGGHCCPGTEPATHAGTCPSSPVASTDCGRACLADTGCATGEKCCHNGCGLSCVRAVSADASPSGVSPREKLGECLPTRDLGAFCVNRRINESRFAFRDALSEDMQSRVDDGECDSDGDCPGLHKCCFDGCVRACAPPHTATQCVHWRASLEHLRLLSAGLFVPACDRRGEYESVQTHNGLHWCVNRDGREIPGTKSRSIPDCRSPRSCAVAGCNKHCPFGRVTDSRGCELCECIQPCEDVVCPVGHACRMVSAACFDRDCGAVPKCVPLACPSGEPLIGADTLQLAECGEGTRCPSGYHCHHIGFDALGYCCPGQAPAAAPGLPACPAVPTLSRSTDGSSCSIGCRSSADCERSVCCYNGCGTSCQFRVGGNPLFLSKSEVAPASSEETIISGPVKVVSPAKTTLVEARPVAVSRRPALKLLYKIGECPAEFQLSGKDCVSDCSSDAECGSVKKCCRSSCGLSCSSPLNATNCIHLLSALDDLLSAQRVITAHIPKCDLETGLFARLQCTPSREECWCVDERTGREVEGTRGGEQTDDKCQAPLHCPTRCPSCPHGVVLDRRGCPLPACHCADPCSAVQCPSGAVCRMVAVAACRHPPCTAIPQCVANPCSPGRPARDPLTGELFECGRGNATAACPPGHSCADEMCCPRQAPIARPSVACPHGDPFTSSPSGDALSCSISANGCPPSHYCATRHGHREGVCCMSKRFVCELPVSAGGCGMGLSRWHYDSATHACARFEWGGCGGNANNFAKKEECEKFCEGIGVDPLAPLHSDPDRPPVELYHLGFALSGQPLKHKYGTAVNHALHEFLFARFGLRPSQLRDVHVRDDNTVRFSIQSESAKHTADSISQEVSAGRVSFPFGGAVYAAEPQTWFARQVMDGEDAEEEEGEGISHSVFWILLVSALVLAVVVSFALCCATVILCRSSDTSKITHPQHLPSHSFVGGYEQRRRQSSHDRSSISTPSDFGERRRHNDSRATTLYY